MTLDYKAVAAEEKKILDAARNLAIARRERSPYSPERQGEFVEKITAYIEKQERERKPLTIAGFILASGIPKQSWYDMKNGRYDAGLEEYKALKGIPADAEEWVTEDGVVLSLIPWSEIVDRCYLLAQQERETACIAGKAGNVVGNIFLLKSLHDLSDQPQQVQHQTNIQVVANAETAIKALEMLK